MASDGELLPPQVLRQIGDKLYDKRKAAALETEQIIKRLVAANDHNRIRLIVDKLAADFANSNQANLRKGALLCLAAATVGLGSPTPAQLQTIVPSVLRSFTDQDARVRYYACEALYNIAKVARTSFLPYFNEVFDAMFRLCADSDTNVMNAIQFLDNLVKDIVVASPTTFNLGAFIPKLRDYLPVMSPPKRTFLISWITVLDSIPDLDMLVHLPSLLDGLMVMLGDPNREIRAQAHKALLEFLVEIQATPHVDFAALGAIQVAQAGSTDDFTRLTAIKWLKELVQLNAVSLAGLYPAILGVVLANISHSSKEIAEMSRQASDVLIAYAPEDTVQGATGTKALPLDTHAILDTISAQLLGPSGMAGSPDPNAAGSAWGGPGDASRLEALRWVELLLTRARGQVLEALPALLPALLDALTSQSHAVANGALGVFAAVARCEGQFRHTLAALLSRFRGPAGVLLLQRGGARVIRRLCGALGAEPVFIELALELQDEKDLAFAATLVQALNLILLTSPEVRDMREALAGAANPNSRPQGVAASQGTALFAALYPCWSHSVYALLSLCFLAQAYDHACDIIQCYRWLPMGSEVLVQMDRLVQLLDAPCFTPLRLSLLQPRASQSLLTALHSLLMLLPQSNAFKALSIRLQAVPIAALLQLDDNLGQASVKAALAATSAAGCSSGHASGRLITNRTAQPWRRPLPPMLWADIDLTTLLQSFCERQQQHFLMELGTETHHDPGAADLPTIPNLGLRMPQASAGAITAAEPGYRGDIGPSPRSSNSNLQVLTGAGQSGASFQQGVSTPKLAGAIQGMQAPASAPVRQQHFAAAPVSVQQPAVPAPPEATAVVQQQQQQRAQEETSRHARGKSVAADTALPAAPDEQD